MSYVVFARKWRPLQFKDLIGQQHVAQTLKNALNQSKIGHGYLFTGTRGVGKTTAARILAKALNCTNLKDSEPCRECQNCLQFESQQTLDIIEIDGASNRGVDDIRDIREQVQYAPMSGKYKIYIIDEVHMLTKEAFNALLKTLEEPPAHILFIFATTEIRKVPATILSRVQRFDFKPISEEHIASRLSFIAEQENIKIEPVAMQLIVQKSRGSMRDALSLMDQVFAFSGNSISANTCQAILGVVAQDVYKNLLTAIFNGDKITVIDILKKSYDSGVDLYNLLVDFGEFLRDLLFTHQPQMTAELLTMSSERFEELSSFAKELTDNDLIRYGKSISDILNDIKTTSHIQLTLEMGFMKMCEMMSINSLDKLVQGLSNHIQKKDNQSEPLKPEPTSPPSHSSANNPSQAISNPVSNSTTHIKPQTNSVKSNLLDNNTSKPQAKAPNEVQVDVDESNLKDEKMNLLKKQFGGEFLDNSH